MNSFNNNNQDNGTQNFTNAKIIITGGLSQGFLVPPLIFIVASCLCSSPPPSRTRFFRIWPLKVPGRQSIGPSAITNSFNNESEGRQDFSNATIKIERCSYASTSSVSVGVIASSFNNKGNGIQNFSNATIIIIGNCCGSLGLHGSRSIEHGVVNSFNNEGNGLQDFDNSTIIVGSCSRTSTCVEAKTHQTGLIKKNIETG
ncbi:hypothetical protein ACSQ67_014190 [Phaseolus vulgaris]